MYPNAPAQLRQQPSLSCMSCAAKLLGMRSGNKRDIAFAMGRDQNSPHSFGSDRSVNQNVKQFCTHPLSNGFLLGS